MDKDIIKVVSGLMKITLIPNNNTHVMIEHDNLVNALKLINELFIECQSTQAKLDRIMTEFCPDDDSLKF